MIALKADIYKALKERIADLEQQHGSVKYGLRIERDDVSVYAGNLEDALSGLKILRESFKTTNCSLVIFKYDPKKVLHEQSFTELF